MLKNLNKLSCSNVTAKISKLSDYNRRENRFKNFSNFHNSKLSKRNGPIFHIPSLSILRYVTVCPVAGWHGKSEQRSCFRMDALVKQARDVFRAR